MKKWLKRGIAFAMTLVMAATGYMTVQVSAYERINGYPDFDPDIFAADMMTDEDSPTKTYQTIKNFLSYESPATTMSENIKQDESLLVAIEAWKALKFKPSEYTESDVKETDYYEGIIFGAIQNYSSSSNVENFFENDYYSEAKKLYESFESILKFRHNINCNIITSADLAKTVTPEQLNECFEAAYSMTFPGIDVTNKSLEIFSKCLSGAESIEKTINKWTAYFKCVQMQDSVKQLVEDLYDNCDGVKNPNMKYALAEVRDACKSYADAFEVSFFDTAEYASSKIMGKMFDSFIDYAVDMNPALKTLSLGRKAGENIANFLFNTDDISGKCYDLMAFSEFEDLLKDVLQQYINEYKANPTNENARKLFAAIDSAYANFDKGCDEATDLCKLLNNSTFNWIMSTFSNKNNYDEAIRVIAAQKKQSELDHKNVRENDYNTALEIEWPEIYNEYQKQVQSQKSQSSSGQETNTGGGGAYISPTVKDKQIDGCIYFYKPSDWGYDIHIYVYDYYKDASIGPSWPGYSMTYIGGNVYKYQYYSNDPAIRIMFNDGYSVERDIKGDCHQVPGKYMEGFPLVNYSFYEVSETQSTNDSSEMSQLKPYVSPSFIIDRLSHPLYGDNISTAEVNVGDSITVRAAGEGGSGSYTYSYYSKKKTDTVWSPIIENTSLSSVEFAPTEIADYEIKINIKDSVGSSADSTYTLKVTDAPQLNNTSVIDADVFRVGENVNISAGANNGAAPYTYAYYYKKSTDSAWTKIAGYCTDTSKTFKPTSGGTYTVRVNVKDSKGNVVQRDFTITVRNDTVAIANNSTVSTTTVAAGTTVTLTGKATGGTESYKFAYYYKKSTDSIWTSAYTTPAGNAYTKNTEITFKPNTAGTYNVRINVKDNNGTVVSKDFKLTVKDAALTNNSTVSATTVTSETEVTLNGKASGGTSPYKYAYYYKKSTDSTWTKAYVTSSGSAYTKYDSVTFKPTTAGTYNVKINVKDQYGEGQVVSKEFTLTVKAALKNSSTISATSVAVNAEVTLNGKASGGTSPYKYAYYYKKSTDSTWTKAYVTSSGSAYTKYDSVTFKPTTAGTYNVKINVKDQYGEGQVVSKEFTLTVKAAAALKNSSTMSATSVTANTEVTLNGKATGGTSPYKYAYYYKKSTDSAWTKAYVTSSGSAYTKYDSVTFKPTTAGTYNVRINVKDKYGEGDVVSKEFTLTVKAASSSLKNSSTISASTTSVNNTLVLTGKASGGNSPYTYAYYYKKSTETSWKKIVMINGSAYSSITTVTFTPDSKGKYDVRVNVKDSSGSVAQKDFTVTVT